jgi:hypothetical protein
LSCDAERVTGLVDGQLEPEAAAAVAVHLAACASCRTQAAEERSLRAHLRSLPAPEPPAALEARVRAQARRRPLAAAVRWALPLAAALLAAFWARGHAPLVAWELARDHDHCFSLRPLPAKVWSDAPRVVEEWFGRQGTPIPRVPDRVGDLALVGARYCPLPDLSSAPHVYYASATSQVSVFVVAHGVRLGPGFAGQARGRAVRLLRVEGETVGVVADSEADARAFEAALRPALSARAGE